MDDPVESPPSVWNGLRVRIGGHYGFVSIRRTVANAEAGKPPAEADDSAPYDYFGSTVNVAARVESIGHGGQILFTKALLEAYDTALHGADANANAADNSSGPAEMRRWAMGPVELRGYNEPVHIHQVSLLAFSPRYFAAFRIAKADNAAISEFSMTEASTAGEQATAAGTQPGSMALPLNSTASADMPSLIAAFCSRRKVKELDVRFGFLAVDSLLSVMGPVEQRRFVDQMIRHWRIPKTDASAEIGAAPSAENTLLFDKLLLASRLGPVASVRERRMFGESSAPVGGARSSRSARSRSQKSGVEESDHLSVVEFLGESSKRTDE